MWSQGWARPNAVYCIELLARGDRGCLSETLLQKQCFVGATN